MKCVIPGGHLKVFGKALHSLSRIGDELWFDPLEKGSLLHVFRSLNILDKNVEKCQIFLNFNSFHMVFRFFCKHGLTKTHNLSYEDCEPQQAVFSKTSCPNVLKIQSRVLSDVIIHFPSCQEEVTLTATPLQITLKSYSDEDIGISKVMHTEVRLNPEEFAYFQIGTDSEVTFCLKEVRGFLSFAEATTALISVHFSKPGQPIVFSLDDIVFEASFILATLTEVNDNTSQKSLISSSLLKEQRSSSNVVKNNEQSFHAGHTKSQQPCIICSPKLQTGRLHPQETPPHTLSYNKFCTLFFGAVSSQKQKEKSDQLFYSLVTSSEDEDDGRRKEFSPKF